MTQPFSKRHNASITLAKMPTWYYFSRPSNMAFHDFTKRHKPQKNLRSLLGLCLKFIPTPSLTNCWSRLKQSSYDRLLQKAKQIFCPINIAHYERYNNNKRSLSSPAIRTSDPRLSSVTITSKSLCGTT